MSKSEHAYEKLRTSYHLKLLKNYAYTFTHTYKYIHLSYTALFGQRTNKNRLDLVASLPGAQNPR